MLCILYDRSFECVCECVCLLRSELPLKVIGTAVKCDISLISVDARVVNLAMWAVWYLFPRMCAQAHTPTHTQRCRRWPTRLKMLSGEDCARLSWETYNSSNTEPQLHILKVKYFCRWKLYVKSSAQMLGMKPGSETVSLQRCWLELKRKQCSF